MGNTCAELAAGGCSGSGSGLFIERGFEEKKKAMETMERALKAMERAAGLKM